MVVKESYRIIIEGKRFITDSFFIAEYLILRFFSQIFIYLSVMWCKSSERKMIEPS